MLTQMPQLLTQSPQATSVGRMETSAPMLPPGPHRPLTPHMPLPASPTFSSRSSAPLFKEDKYSSTSEEETEADAEITFIHSRNQPNGWFTNNPMTERPTSTPMMADYTTQGDPDASPSTSNLFRSTANFWAQTIFSFQMAATDAYTRSITKFIMQVTWKMATTHISWSYLL